MGIAPFRALHPSYTLENNHRFIYSHSIVRRRRGQQARKGISAMPVTHEPWLVALSLIVAIQGAYVGLSLAVQVAGAVGLRRRLLLAGAAISLAVAIWSMHFVGMLAARLPLPGRLPRLPDAAVVPGLRDRGRRRRYSPPAPGR